MWGLAFKPGTDDMREAPSLALIHALLDAGAKVRAYDPVALHTASRALPHAAQENGDLLLLDDQYSAVDGADALILVTEWEHFREPDFNTLRARMHRALFIDGRNQFHPDDMHRHGFRYIGVGRGHAIA